MSGTARSGPAMSARPSDRSPGRGRFALGDAPSSHIDAFAVTVDERMKLREGTWDASEARRKVFADATEAGNTDLKKASLAHTVADLNPEGGEPTRADLKLPIATIEDGERVGVGNAIRNALARLPQTDAELAAAAQAAGMGLSEFAALALPDRPEDVAAVLAETDGLSDSVRAEARRVLTALLDRLKEQTAQDLIADGVDEPTARGWVGYNDELNMMSERRKVWRRTDASPTTVAPTAATFAQRPVMDSGVTKVWRTTSVPLQVTDETRRKIDRALEIADATEGRNDAETFAAAIEKLKADGLETTAEGFVIFDALAARTGTQIYSDGHTTWGEFRSFDEVKASLPSYSLRPYTNDHPPVLVTPSNYVTYARGVFGQDARMVGPLEDGYHYVAVSVMVGDAQALRDISNGKVELSMGYTTMPKDLVGEDVNGIAHVIAQTEIDINHGSGVDFGRAGPRARLQVDAHANTPPEPKDPPMTTKDQRKTDGPGDVSKMLQAAYAAGDLYAELDRAAIAEALSSMVSAAVLGEEIAPEAAAALAELIQAPPEAVAEAVRRQPAQAPPPPEVEMEAEEQDVPLFDGGPKVKMSKDAAAALAKHHEGQAASLAALQAAAKKKSEDSRTTSDALETRLAAQEGQLAVMRASLEDHDLRREASDREAVVKKVAEVCPDLAKKWRPDDHGLTLAQMQAAVVEDLAAGYKPTIDRYKPAEDASDEAKKRVDAHLQAFIGPVFEHEVAQAEQRRAGLDSPSKPAAPNGSLNNLCARSYGHRPN